MKTRESLHCTVVLCSVLSLLNKYSHYDDYILFSDEETWWWTLLTDPQVVAAIITVIGGVITTYQCCKLVYCTHVLVLVQFKQ